jgi:hypothetical protein
MMNKKFVGFTIIEVTMAMVMMAILFLATMPLMTARRLSVGTEKYVYSCVNKDSGTITTDNCVKAISYCKVHNASNGCNNLTELAVSGTTAQQTASLGLLNEICSQGGELACNFFINKCINDSSKCTMGSGSTGIRAFLSMNQLSNNMGKLFIEKTLKTFYDNGVSNIMSEVNSNCGNCYSATAACNVRNYGVGLCTCGSVTGNLMNDGSIKVGFINNFNVCAMPADLANNNTWNNAFAGSYVTSATSAIDGLLNTEALLNASSGAFPYAAARDCADVTEYGHTDWYLPSSGELTNLFTNRVAIGNFDTTAEYWSSTEVSGTNAYTVNFSSGSSTSRTKNTAYSIRCIRRDR